MKLKVLVFALFVACLAHPALADGLMLRGVSSGGSTLPPPQEEFVGPFPNWINAKTGLAVSGTGPSLCTGATGDGSTNDSGALQSCLNALGSTHPVLYLPASTYRIQATLTLASQQYVSVIGQDPATTTILWGGSAGGTMILINGVAYSRFDRLTFNGQNIAFIAVDQSKQGSGGFFDTGNEYSDDVFKNAGIGLRCGAAAGGGCAETSMLRDQFLNNSAAGIKLDNFNALDMFVWYSLFQNNDIGITNNALASDPGGAGNFHVYNSIFQNSTSFDIRIGNTGSFNIRNNYSAGSNYFVYAGNTNNPANIAITGNTILDTTNPLSVYVGNLGPVVLIDNTIRSLGSVSTGPVVQGAAPAQTDLFSMGNTFTVSSPTQTNGHYHSIQDTVVARSTVNPTMPTLPGPLSNNNRTIFEASSSGAGSSPCNPTPCSLQTAITAAAASVTVKPVVHIQFGSYSIPATITVPANSDMQIIGDGGYSQLAWSGVGAGPVMSLAGPSKATLRDFLADGNSKSADGIRVDNADQPDSRVFMEQPFLALSTQNLLVDGLDYTSIEAHDFLHSQVFSPNISIKIIGGPQAAAGNWQGGKTAIFAGASSVFTGTGYDVSNGAHLLVDDTWFEAGDPIIFSARDLYTTITYSGARLGSDTVTTNVALTNFRGNAALISLLMDGNVAITGTGTGANVLGLGLVGPSSTFFSNTSTGTTTEFLNGQSTASPPPGSASGPLTEVPSTPDTAFLTTTLSDYRTFTPTTPPIPSELPAGVTDARFYRMIVNNANDGIALAGLPYIGPCNVVACTGPWYGLRGASAAAANGSTNAVRLQRASDNATQNIVVLATGKIDVATATTFCASTTCGIEEAYDQSGTNLCASGPCDITQGVFALQPIFTFNCVGSLPCAVGSGNQYISASDNTFSLALPTTAYTLCQRDSGTSYQACSSTVNDSTYLGFLNSLGFGRFADSLGNQITPAVTNSACHVLLGVLTTLGTNSIFAVDNVETTGTLGSGLAISADKVTLMTHGVTADAINGKWFESGWWGSALSSGNRTAIRSNASTFWSCSP